MAFPTADLHTVKVNFAKMLESSIINFPKCLATEDYLLENEIWAELELVSAYCHQDADLLCSLLQALDLAILLFGQVLFDHRCSLG